MRVLLLPANNAPEFQVNALENIINKYEDHKVVRWYPTISDSEFDFAIIIAGKHNQRHIRLLWNKYYPDKRINMDDIIFEPDDKIHIGKGLYSFIHNTGNKLYLLMAPTDNDSDIISDFRDDHNTRGPGFLLFDQSDVQRFDESDYKMKHGYIELLSITDTTAYKYRSIIEENGGQCIVKNQLNTDTTIAISPDNIDHYTETPLSLLLLRR